MIYKPTFMIDTKVKKEKVIREFREELKLKEILKREIYDESFFKILNHVYKHNPNEIKANINRLNNLTFLIIHEHKYIYIEMLNNNPRTTLLSITIMGDDYEDGGIFNLTLDMALEKIDELWTKTI